jgi:hypothetical protein
MDTLPRDIRIGMTVYDSAHHAIGKVEDFKFSENEDNPDVVPADIDGTDRRDGRETILGAIADAFGAEEIPEALRSRLLTEGYIRLDAKGLLAKDRFILPSQIATSFGDEITLNVDKDQLVKQP